MLPDATAGSLAGRLPVGPLQDHLGLLIHLPLGACWAILVGRCQPGLGAVGLSSIYLLVCTKLLNPWCKAFDLPYGCWVVATAVGVVGAGWRRRWVLGGRRSKASSLVCCPLCHHPAGFPSFPFSCPISLVAISDCHLGGSCCPRASTLCPHPARAQPPPSTMSSPPHPTPAAPNPWRRAWCCWRRRPGSRGSPPRRTSTPPPSRTPPCSPPSTSLPWARGASSPTSPPLGRTSSTRATRRCTASRRGGGVVLFSGVMVVGEGSGVVGAAGG